MFAVNDIKCPGCGAPQKYDSEICEYCGRPVIITSVRTAGTLAAGELKKYADVYRKEYSADPENTKVGLSLGICLYELKLYDNAVNVLRRCIETDFDDPELYYYLALSSLKGRKPFNVPRKEIDKIEEYLNTAIALSPCGVYYYLFAYIRYDHHHRKMYVMDPDYTELLRKAQQCGITEADKAELFRAIGVTRPSAL